MNKKSPIKVVNKLQKKAGARYRKVTLTPRQVRIKQELGNGFRRHVFNPVNVNPNTFIILSLAPEADRVVISGGWRVSGFTSGTYAMESFPIEENRWFITVWNNSGVTRTITPYLISKRR